jgi:Na+-translocating ferredoxin:NAD+ oxidoreductase RnfG subunit
VKKIALLYAALVFGLASIATAQSGHPLIGTWVHTLETGFCGTSIFKISAVDADGTVRGSFTCTKTKWTPAMGNKIGRNDVKGTFDGTHFIMLNADGGGVDLTLNGTKLEGTGRVRASSPAGAVVYTKQQP